MIGTPRTMSTYSVAARRRGKSSGERTLRDNAMTMPNNTMSGALTRKMRTSSQKALATGRKAWENVAPSKNALCTDSQPDNFGTCLTINPTIRVVLPIAIHVLRRRCLRSNCARRLMPARDGADALSASAPCISVTSSDVSWSSE